jgi:hypothetical protein
MAKPRFDGVVEAARYRDGKLTWVRAYERRGATFGDVVLLEREALLSRMKAGRRFVTGRRQKALAGTFLPGKPLQLIDGGSGQWIATTPSATRDLLEDVPIV